MSKTIERMKEAQSELEKNKEILQKTAEQGASELVQVMQNLTKSLEREIERSTTGSLNSIKKEVEIVRQELRKAVQIRVNEPFLSWRNTLLTVIAMINLAMLIISMAMWSTVADNNKLHADNIQRIGYWTQEMYRKEFPEEKKKSKKTKKK